MNRFKVMDRHLQIHRNYLLEASAGTGKTFSIQNIIVRFLIETSEDQIEPFPLNKLLVVTFTRASTRDLRLRIRADIEQALDILSDQSDSFSESIPDYLKAIFPTITDQQYLRLNNS